MAKANFPASPTNGQTVVIGGITYIYNSSKGVWRNQISNIGNTSDTPPANAVDGQLWYNSSDLNLYVYYNDGSSSQWVQSAPQQAGVDGTFSGTVSQSIIPDTDSAYDLGSPTKKFKSLYLSSDTLYLGDSASISAGSGGEIILPSLKIGTGANAVKLEADASGKLKTKKIISGVTQAAEEPGNATVVTDMAGLIALTGMSTGQIALVSALNRVFMYTGTGWFKIADMTNATPTDITGVNGSYDLATDGTATTITAVSTDPEGFPLTWSYAVTTGSLGSTATVSQADNVFTITPSTTEADAGSFSITFSVTDGATGAVSAVSTFNLTFYTLVKPTVFASVGNGSTAGASIASQNATSITYDMKALGGSYQGNRTTMAAIALPYGKYYFEVVKTSTTTYSEMFTLTNRDFASQPNNANFTSTSYGWIYNASPNIYQYYPTNDIGTTYTSSGAYNAFWSLDSHANAESRMGIAYDSVYNRWWMRLGRSAWLWGDPVAGTGAYNSSTAGSWGSSTSHKLFFGTSAGGSASWSYSFRLEGKPLHQYSTPTGFTAI